jgi:hypothetical protein
MTRILGSVGASIFSLAYSVIGIEMTLYWNSITGVYTINTTGQLIPFVIGLAGLAKVVYEPVKLVSYPISFHYSTPNRSILS